MYINADMRSYIISCAATLSYYEALLEHPPEPPGGNVTVTQWSAEQCWQHCATCSPDSAEDCRRCWDGEE